MADLRISQLPPLTGAILQADDALAIVDGSASETKKVTSKDLIQSGIALIDAGSIPSDKFNITLGAGSVGTTELADGSVTAPKLADNSSAVYGAALPATGAYQGQLAVLSADGRAYIWSGSAWAAFGTGIASVTGGQVGDITTTVTTVGADVSVWAQVDDSTVPAAFLAGPTSSGGAVELRTIVPADLPIATTTTAGIVTVPSGGGLTIDGGDSGLGSDLVIDNEIAPSSDNLLVAYNANGLVIGGRAIEGSDLPIATNGSVGAISAGPEFAVTPAGQLQIRNQVTASGHPYVQYDSNGLITSGRDLTAADIPDLDASKITSGTFPTGLLADGSVTRPKLADYAIAYIQEASPSVTAPGHIGVLWYQESTGQLRMWNGNSWMPVGFGRLSNDNLRWGGLVDPTTGFVVGVTDSGANAGLTVGDPLPEATNALGGLYVVANNPGDQIGVTPGVFFDPGDWCLCINENEGWVRIDTMVGGGGGGGGASTLDELLDVTLTGPTDGQYLQLGDTGQWVNVDLNALQAGDPVSELDNDAGYLTQAEVNNILNGNNPDGTPNPGSPEYITADDVGDGTITITTADGTEVGSFTVNQAGDTSIALPADVVPSAPGDGKLSIVDQDDNELFSFTADQATNTDTVVKLTAADIGALPDDASLEFVPLGSWANIPARTSNGGGDGGDGGGGGGTGTATVTVTSSSFAAGSAIDNRFYYDQAGCPGSNDSPQLSWSFTDLPTGATITSWALNVSDPDGDDWIHWLVENIPAGQTSIAENGSWDAGATVQDNSYAPDPSRANGWGGPCPPPGESHTYNIVVIGNYNDSEGNAQQVQSAALTFTASAS